MRGITGSLSLSIFDVWRSGTMEFERVPVDGSKKMPDDYMDSIEPFDYAGLKPFSTAYLPGYLADKYDVTAHETVLDLVCRLLLEKKKANETGRNLRRHRPPATKHKYPL